MSEMPKLQFPQVHLRARRRAEQVEVWDELRAMWLVLTPEEWVRQHLIAFLVAHCGASAGRVVQEYAVALNGQAQRADVVVVDDAGRPLLLAECKASEVPIDQDVMAQAVRYNSVLNARYVILTNGNKHFCFEYRAGEYLRMERFPQL
ncbi:MAG: type I restriction enzyme HsdR N-terminal domain-containing protein [Alistipes sp.]